MKKNWKQWAEDIFLALSLFCIGIMISGNYDYTIDDDGVLFGISFFIIVRFFWKKIDKKFFK